MSVVKEGERRKALASSVLTNVDPVQVSNYFAPLEELTELATTGAQMTTGAPTALELPVPNCSDIWRKCRLKLSVYNGGCKGIKPEILIIANSII